MIYKGGVIGCACLEHWLRSPQGAIFLVETQKGKCEDTVAPIREWKSQAGSMISARLLGYSGQCVLLLGETGKLFRLESDQLSSEGN